MLTGLRGLHRAVRPGLWLRRRQLPERLLRQLQRRGRRLPGHLPLPDVDGSFFCYSGFSFGRFENIFINKKPTTLYLGGIRSHDS
jgi:hypothetical protein